MIPDMENMKYGNHFYYGDHEEVVEGFHPDNGLIGQNFAGWEHVNIPSTDVYGGVSENNPLFVGYTLGDFNPANSRNNNDLKMITNMFEMFKPAANSPVLQGGTTEISPIFNTYVVNGRTYTTPLPSSFFGAIGAN